MGTVLVVDDNATNRKLLVTILSGDGHLTLEASDGLEGLRLARAHHPQLVISDVVMPTMDGYGFVRAMRADATLRRTPVIFYTAHYHEREAHSLAQACGVVHVLVKPSPATDLLRVVEQVMAGMCETAPPPLPENFDREHLRLVTDKLTERTATLSAFQARFEAAAALGAEIGTVSDLDTLLKRLCTEARKIFGASYAVIGAADAGDTPVRFHASGISFGDSPPQQPVLLGGVLGEVRASRQARRVSGSDAAKIGLPERYPSAAAFLVVPLASAARCYGWLCLADKLGADQFDAHDEALLSLLSTLGGLAYENLLPRATSSTDADTASAASSGKPR